MQGLMSAVPMSAEQRSQNIPSQLPPSPASHNKHTLITCILSCRRPLALSPLQGHPPQTCFRKADMSQPPHPKQ